MTRKFEPCPMNAYVDWLYAYLGSGGTIHRYCDYSFEEDAYLRALADFGLNNETSVNAATILAPRGIRFWGRLGHNNVYTEDPLQVHGEGPLVYDDDLFRGLPGYAEARAAAEEKKRHCEHEKNMRAYLEKYGNDSDLNRYRADMRGHWRPTDELLECASCGVPRNNDFTVQWQGGNPYCDHCVKKGVVR